MPGEIIDLSHPLSSEMFAFPGDPSPVIEKYANLEKDGYNASWFEIGSHLGTHVDAPYHILQQGKALDEFPLENFIGKGVCIDCTSQNNISAEYIKKQLSDVDFEFMLLYTGWQKFWNSKNYFSGFPFLEEEATKLLSSYSLKGVGIDAPSFDPIDCELVNHKILLGKNILLIENLCNLPLLLNKRFDFYCLPLNYSKADGSPIRACAKLIVEQ